MPRPFAAPIVALVSALALVAACGDDEPPPADAGADASALDGGTPATDAGMADAGPCPRPPGAADGLRRIVVSHPFDAAGGQDSRYQVLALSPGGDISPTGESFRMGRATSGEIVFTPDGEVGLVAQEDGTLGVFRIATDGSAEVLHSAYAGDFYAASVVMDPSGTHAWVLDSEWRDSGGGIYRVDIGCDGTLEADRLVAPSKLPYAMVIRDDGTALLAAKDVLDSTPGHDAFLVDLGDPPAVRSAADGFPDDEFIISSAALSANGQHFLVGDNAAFSSVPNRVAVLAVMGGALSAAQLLAPLEDPVGIATSPFDDVALVVSGFGNAVWVLDYAPDAPAPFEVRGELAYTGAAPHLPGTPVVLRRGRLRGMTILAENVGVRRIVFHGGGEVRDLGVTNLGSGTQWVVGAIGVQP